MYDLESMELVAMDRTEMAETNGGSVWDWVTGKYKEYTQNPPMEQAQNI
ncbi:MAG TPA: hypothetical protein VFH27_12975 [Longimicrobiaceae bacterium]|nr:hypothetical protein [Longimicrobiaceae bacterium]